MNRFFSLWILACAYLNGAGWMLAAMHQLNPAGYAGVLVIGFAGLLFWWWKTPDASQASLHRQKYLQRFRRLFPAFFLLSAFLVFLGGALYAPSNFDALTYRLPRMLNWQSTGHWFWIPTTNQRMNFSGTVWEWIAMPFLVLIRSDRGLFLINALGFLLMPGLLFSIFRQLGVAGRVAWTWMWILPLAYGYLTQAGSIGNDFTGTIFGLLSIYFGLRARHSQKVGDLWLALLAAALLTGVKLSNLPLALPCVLAAWPALGLLRKHLFHSLLAAGIAVLVSALPVMVLNQWNTGNWNGDPHNQYQIQIKNPVIGWLGNGVLLAEQSLMPPVFPGASRFNRQVIQALPDFLQEQFPRLQMAGMNALPGEEGAGVGLTTWLPLLLVAIISLFRCRRGGWREARRIVPPVVFAGGIAALFFISLMGSEAGPRLLLPYYPLIVIPFLLLSTQSRWLRFRIWRGFLLLMVLSTLPIIIFSPARPLWPAQTVLGYFAKANPDNKIWQWMGLVYGTYAHRNDLLAPVRSMLPPDAREIGFIASSNDTDYSLWRPFGRRTVKYLGYDLPSFLQQPNVEWVVVKENDWSDYCSLPVAQWAQAHHAKIVVSPVITTFVSHGPEKWYLLHIEKPAASAPNTQL